MRQPDVTVLQTHAQTHPYKGMEQQFFFETQERGENPKPCRDRQAAALTTTHLNERRFINACIIFLAITFNLLGPL